MRYNHRTLTVATVMAVLFVLAVPGFAGVVSHVGGSGNNSASSHAYANVNNNDPLLYAQNTNFNGALASQNDTNGFGNFATTFDNFTLGSASNITSFAWIGSYFNPGTQGNITAFTLTFYADAGGAPGATLATYSGPGTFGETFLGNDNVGDPTFIYQGNLGTPFAVAAGTQYWVSIVPDLGFPPQWGWETGTGGDGAGYQCFFGTCGPIASDLSFALYGTGSTVPEPGTLVMLGTGVLGLAGTIRRKLF